MRFLDVGEYSNQIRRAEKGLDPAKWLYISLESGGKVPLMGEAEIEQNYISKDLAASAKRKCQDHLDGKVAKKMKLMSDNQARAQQKSWKKIDATMQERLRPCSGRDEMCLEVLNDDWASHPTWASEDSGFVAHRKNMFEESLHRIEEERHDYDFNIEANAKVIQLLEPIGQQILSMDQAQREAFRMPIGLGGQSQAIYKRVMKKVYGERGPEVVADLFKDPCAVLPIVLARLKQKDEEWRFTQVSFYAFLEMWLSLT